MRWIDMGSALERSAARHGDRIMLSDVHGDVTYAEAYDRAAELAGRLLATGIAPGDRVVTVMRNSADYVLLLFACSLARIVACPINRRYSSQEIGHAVADTRARAIFSDPLTVADCLTIPGPPDLLRVVVGVESGSSAPGWLPDADLARGDFVPSSTPPDDDEVHTIHYTSGSTSRPKGVVRSHGANAAIALGSLEAHPVLPGDTWLVALPMHSAGIYAAMFAPVVAGGRIFVTDYAADATGPLMERERITHLTMGPTMWYAARESLARSDVTALRHAMWGGMAVPEGTIRAIADVLPVPPLSAYGMTESTSMCYSTPEVYESGRILSSGFPISTMDIRVLAPDGTRCGPAEVGEVVVRGPHVFTRYLNAPEATAEALRDGWLHTGDRGWTDADGALTVTGRISGVIISGNENVYPEEVEGAISDIPGVEQVSVIGVPNERWGQEICAYVVAPGVSAERIQAGCRSTLSRFKVPKRVFMVGELPKDPQGKVQRAVLVRETPQA